MSRLVAQSLSAALARKPILSGVDLALEAGRFTVIIGPNGAGKTTLLRSLAGLLKPAQGQVSFNDKSLTRMPSGERARAIAYLPQAGTIAWPLPVADIVALGRLPHGETPDALTAQGRDAVAHAIAAVGLNGFERRASMALSGGERARVLLARALATQAPVLLVDEPVAALDPRHQLIVLDVLKAYAGAGHIVVAIMHDLGLAARYADDIVLMETGSIRVKGSPEAVLTQTHLAEAFGVMAHVESRDGRLLVALERPLP